jgi:cytochrome P450
VDAFPLLKHLPSWLPGAGFQKTAQKFKMTANAMMEAPYGFVLRQMAAGESFVSKLVQQRLEDTEGPGLTPFAEEEIMTTAAVMYLGGSDTLLTTFKVFILCMVLFPDVQRKAQEEIDRVVGPNKLPTVSDQQRLPYVEGVIKEAYRWMPAVPLGLAHATSEDIEYDGTTIPKGAVIMPAVWWFCHDPESYKDPDVCDPERYLEPRNERDPRLDIFGYGRRSCIGRFLADTLVFLTVAQMLASFNIGRAVDENGNEVEPKLEFEPAISCLPKDFGYSITPRSKEHADMIWRIGAQEGDEDDSGFLDTSEVTIAKDWESLRTSSL